MPCTVLIVDVGQGDCTVAVDHHTKEALLIDCNGGHHEAAIAALNDLGFSAISAAVVTHSHLDHFGGMLDVLEELAEHFTGRLFYNHDTLLAMPRFAEEPGDNRTIVRSLINRILELGDVVSSAQPIIGVQTIGTMTWRLLAPTHFQLTKAIGKGDPNLASGIVLVESEGHSVIIGGDAQLEAWRNAQADLPVGSIVRWPHHGGRISNSPNAYEELLHLLDPSAVLVSVGADNQHSHPSDHFFAAARAHGSQLLCTQATTKCADSADMGECAGSIRIHLQQGTPPQPSPSRSNHQAFITSLASARCL